MGQGSHTDEEAGDARCRMWDVDSHVHRLSRRVWGCYKGPAVRADDGMRTVVGQEQCGNERRSLLKDPCTCGPSMCELGVL